MVGHDEIIFETGHVASQANGAVIVRCGETMVLATACAAPKPDATTDFLPLRVDYQEKFSSAGKTVSGFIKREGRPSEREILVSRLIDRPLRPMFPDGYYNEVQVLSYVWSYDGMHSPDPLAICACSAALSLSDIPLVKPIAGVRVGYLEGSFVINPTVEQMGNSRLDLMLAGTEDAILMIEGFCDFLTEDQVLEAIRLGHEAIATICQTLARWQEKLGKAKNLAQLHHIPEEVAHAVAELASHALETAHQIKEKQLRQDALDLALRNVCDTLCPEEGEQKFPRRDVTAAFQALSSQTMRRRILRGEKRADGRSNTEIRPISIQQHPLPRAHGSSLFTRGETQALAVCTLGGETMAQRYENLNEEGSQRFYLHYFFPPFSVGEVGRIGAPGRREVGHGNLAERALRAVIPQKDSFPYTMRVESTILSCNGSSSMATVCGGCLALMDAGVPLKSPVAGIAMGVVLEESRYVILSDILGMEDALGDMDFKVTGNDRGITAFQMDIKVEGITIAIMADALAQAREGRRHILQEMLKACPAPSTEMSKYAPRIETMKVNPSKIGAIIGPGGKQIREIIAKSGAQIDIDDVGMISIAATDLRSVETAKAMINSIVAEVEVGKVYSGRIVSIVPFGAFVEILPGKEGLCHISEFDHGRIEKLEDHAKVGDIIQVKVLKINERGQIQLSRKSV